MQIRFLLGTGVRIVHVFIRCHFGSSLHGSLGIKLRDEALRRFNIWISCFVVAVYAIVSSRQWLPIRPGISRGSVPGIKDGASSELRQGVAGVATRRYDARRARVLVISSGRGSDGAKRETGSIRRWRDVMPAVRLLKEMQRWIVCKARFWLSRTRQRIGRRCRSILRRISRKMGTFLVRVLLTTLGLRCSRTLTTLQSRGRGVRPQLHERLKNPCLDL